MLDGKQNRQHDSLLNRFRAFGSTVGLTSFILYTIFPGVHSTILSKFWRWQKYDLSYARVQRELFFFCWIKKSPCDKIKIRYSGDPSINNNIITNTRENGFHKRVTRILESSVMQQFFHFPIFHFILWKTNDLCCRFYIGCPTFCIFTRATNFLLEYYKLRCSEEKDACVETDTSPKLLS